MNVESQADFARRLGKNKSHVTRLKQAGRLVMHGNKVAISESLAMLEATESPLPRDVAKREALQEQRQAKAAEPILAGSTQTLESIGKNIKLSQARKMSADADMAEMERARLEGALVESNSVKVAGMDIGAKIRANLESLPDRLAPEMAATTETVQAHGLLAEAMELVLADMAREIAALDEKLKAH